uniref:Uncharacterized protein n=1 Tax=Strongyloides stercoralis TaxID=6248 RepID=A0A0K0EAR1_STRER
MQCILCFYGIINVSCEYFFKAFVSVIFFLPDLMLKTCYENEKSFIKLYNFIWNYQKNVFLNYIFHD